MPAKGQRSGIYVKCDYCGKDVYKTKSWANRPHIHNFCSYDCQMALKSIEHSELRKCEWCGYEFSAIKSNPQRFCSVECQHEWQKTNVGEKSAKYKRVKKQCGWCGKDIMTPVYKVDTQDHYFCSVDCRRSWYANIYSQSDDWKEKCRVRGAKIIQNGTMKQTESSPQLILNSLLDRMGIKYEREYNLKYYSADNYLADYGLIIEVMGDFWHCNPVVYDEIKYDKQRKTVSRDKAKRTYVRRFYGTEILYLWESDLNNNPDLFESLINMFIKHSSQMENYNSFNYHLSNGQPELNDIIIMTFFEKENAA